MILFYILILSFPLIEHPIFGRDIGGFTVEKYLGVLCIGYALFYVTRARRRVTVFHSGQVWAFLLFYLWALASFFGVSGPLASHDLIRAYTSHLIFLFVIYFLVDSTERLRWSMLSCVAAMALASLYCLREWQTGVAEHGMGYRPGYVTGDPNYFTASAILCLPMASLFIFQRRKLWERGVALGGLLVTLPAIAVCGSRGGLIGIMAMVAFAVFRSRRPWRNGIALGTVLAVAFGVLAMIPQSPVDRMLHPIAGDIESANIRLQLWDAGFEMIRQHPVMGIGLGNFKPSVGRYFPVNADTEALLAHNTYMENTAEMGIPGLLGFLAIFAVSFVSLELTRRRARAVHAEFISQTANALQAGLFGFAFSIFFLSAEFLKLFWFAVFLGGTLPQVLAYSLAAETKASSAGVASLPGKEVAPELSPAVTQEENVLPETDRPLYDPIHLTSPAHAILTAPPNRRS